MRREPIDRTLTKANHWPIAKQRQYLMQVFACEKDRHRRRRIRQALVGLTTKVLNEEMARERA